MTRDPLRLFHFAMDIVACAAAAGTGVFVWLRKRSARNWPSVPGKIQFGEVVGSPNGHKTAWTVDLSYSYVVDCQYYAGKYQIKARSEDHAHEMAQTLKDQVISVRYSSKDPATSVVLDQDQMSFLGQDLARR